MNKIADISVLWIRKARDIGTIPIMLVVLAFDEMRSSHAVFKKKKSHLRFDQVIMGQLPNSDGSISTCPDPPLDYTLTSSRSY
jgi:hypothetical protein